MLKTAHPLYVTWHHMLYRCSNPASNSYIYYGARGITVCDRWHNFWDFISDMGDKPAKNYQIDRINNDGNYEPGNCRWVTCADNVKNRRPCTCHSRTRRPSTYVVVDQVEIDGQVRSLTEWCRIAGIKYNTAAKRLANGHSVREALFTPTRLEKSHKNSSFEIDGEVHSVTVWCQIVGIPRSTVCRRLRKGWSIEKALRTPQLR